MAYDEALMLRDVEVSLSLMPDLGKDSWFKTNAEYDFAMVSAEVVVIIAFLAAIYFFVLPKHIRNLVFGIGGCNKEDEKAS